MDSEYKDVQTARDPDGTLMLYLPLTRPNSGLQNDTLYVWDAASGAFVDQTATLLPFINPAIDRGTYDVDFVDIDGDGDFDIAHSSPHGNYIYVNRRNEAAGSFADETAIRLPAFMRTDGRDVWDDVTSGDVDGDGDLDLMFSNRNFSGVHAGSGEQDWGPNVLAYNDGTGRFGLTAGTRQLFGLTVPLASGGTEQQGASHGSKFADFNNDGRLDLIITHESGYWTTGAAVGFVAPPAPDYEILINLGDQNGDGLVDWSTTPVTQGGKIINVGVFDYDSDGNIDLYLARSLSDDQIVLGQGDGTFAAPLLVSDLSDGVNDTSYDVAFADFNDDGAMDIVTVQADGTARINHLYLNDRDNPNPTAPRLLVSNEQEFNPGDAGMGNGPLSSLSAQPMDVDGDGDVDVILGADARKTDREPLVVRNTLDVSDGHLPELEHPALLLSAYDEPTVMFRVRVRDRLIDFDEIDAVLDWSTTGANGGAASGNVPLTWAAQMTYQAMLSCNDLRTGFDDGEAITSFDWTATANDSVMRPTPATVAAGDPGVPDLLAALTGLAADNGVAVNILEPMGQGAAPIVSTAGGDQLLVRVAVTPGYITPDLGGFQVTIDGSDAPILASSRLGDQVWFVVQTPSGPGGVHDLAVSYRLCGSTPVQDSVTNAVAYDDNPEASDVVLVVDTSGSMNRDGKLEAAVNAGSLLTNTLGPDDRIGVVDYSGFVVGTGEGRADTVLDLTAADTAGRNAAIAALGGLSANGCTPIGQGLLQGVATLDDPVAAPPSPLRALILLSDGLENVPPYWAAEPDFLCSSAPPGVAVSTVFDGLNADPDPTNDVRVDTVAFGPSAPPQLMAAIAAATGGSSRDVRVDPGASSVSSSLAMPRFVSLAVAPLLARSTGATAQELGNRLADTYEHFHNGLVRQDRLWQGLGSGQPRTVKLPDGTPKGMVLDNGELVERGEDAFFGDLIEVPVPMDLERATLSVNWTGRRNVAVGLIPPEGQDLKAIQVARAETNAVFTVKGASAGVWRLLIETRESFESLVMLSGRSPYNVFARLLTGYDSDRHNDRGGLVPRITKPGEPIPVALMATLKDRPVRGAQVQGWAVNALGERTLFGLRDDGRGLDHVENDGVYTGAVEQTKLGGPIDMILRADWSDASGRQTRIVALTAQAIPLDSDGDGVGDAREIVLDLDPNNPDDVKRDHDQDELATYRELMMGLDPFNPDTDAGGTPDGKEVFAGSDPEDPRDDEDGLRDSDDDGLPDRWERLFKLDPSDPQDAEADFDDDRLSNLEEYKAGSNPRRFDTDGDGINDGDEVEKDLDPVDPRA